MAIHDRLAPVLEALWSHLLVTAAQSLALGWLWVSVVQEAVSPPNDQRGAHAVAVEGVECVNLTMTTWGSLVA